MRLNRFLALAAIALLAVGAIGAVSARTSAQTSQPSASRARAVAAPHRQGLISSLHKARVSKQMSDQPAPSTGRGVSPIRIAASQTITGTEPDQGLDQQAPLYTSSIVVPQTAGDSQSETDEAAALAKQAKITVEQAKTAALGANPGTTVIKAELDNENGALVYSVELSSGADVKVDAGNGAILHTEAGGQTESGGQAEAGGQN